MKELSLTTRQKNILAKKGINTGEELLNLLPRAYKDYRYEYTEVERRMKGFTGCFIGKPYKLSVKYSNNRSIITFKLRSLNEQQINICIIGQNFMFNILQRMMEEDYIAVFGTLDYHEVYGYSIMSPDHVCYLNQVPKFKKVEPVYSKISGISDETMRNLIKETLNEYETNEIEDSILIEHGFVFPTRKQAYDNLHFPDTLDDIDISKRRVDFDKLLEFALALRKQVSEESKGTAVILNKLKVTKDIIDNLPYELTEDQKKHINKMIMQIREGKRVSALLQGDVGCGKTMVAILMLFALAENGYQAVLMAPTSILASQHFEQIKEIGDKYGINTAYLDGNTKASEKNKIYKSLSDGSLKILVGTHSLTNDKIKYSNLGIVIIDEEHRFGVEQRNALLSHSKYGVNTIVMSATPMPRTLAGVLHNPNTEILDIKTMPLNRQPIKTGIADNEERIFTFIESELEKGRQAYVICPLIEEKEEDTATELIRSVIETKQIYEDRFSPKYKIDSISGKLSPSEMEDKITAFKNKEIDILISTTVVEVGVNVPNASVIVISNAERFGLAQLHQLRGRVGRGEHKSCCILQSNHKDNERLNALVRCSSGFDIAEEDLKLRGAGDLTGVKQSGFTEVMDLIASDMEFYKNVDNLAKTIIDNSMEL